MKRFIKGIKNYLPSIILTLLIICTGITGAVYAKYITRAEKEIDLTVDAYGHMDVALCRSADKAQTWQNVSFNIVPAKSTGCAPYVYLGLGNEEGYVYIKVVENIGGGLTFSDYVRYGVRTDTWTLLSQNGSEKIYWKYVTPSNTDQYFGIINNGASTNDQVYYPDTITEAKMAELKDAVDGGGEAPSIVVTAYSCHSVNVAGTANTAAHAQAVWTALQTELNK